MYYFSLFYFCYSARPPQQPADTSTPARPPHQPADISTSADEGQLQDPHLGREACWPLTAPPGREVALGSEGPATRSVVSVDRGAL